MPAANATPNGITIREVAQHASIDDCWSSVNGRVHNLTPLLKMHPDAPTGPICGKDASVYLNARMGGANRATIGLGGYFIGALVKR